MTIDFPCSVHKDTYENSLIAVDNEHLKELSKDGWLISSEFLNLSSDDVAVELAQKKRGPKPKTDDTTV